VEAAVELQGPDEQWDGRGSDEQGLDECGLGGQGFGARRHDEPGLTAPRAWYDGTVVGFDLETTGTDPLTARIVTAAVVHHRADDTVADESCRWLVDPGIDIPESATAVHGITTAYAREHGEPAAIAVGAVADALTAAWSAGLPIVIFNAAYDVTLLNAELLRHGQVPLAERTGWADALIIDPLVIDRAVDRYRRGKRTLQDAALHYRIVADDAHSADGDAVATCRLARAIAASYPEVAAAGFAALRSQQQVWSAEWAVRFQAFLRSRGQVDAVIDGTWPLRVG
jgi:DNA polymerase-3 subunit epsilon